MRLLHRGRFPVVLHRHGTPRLRALFASCRDSLEGSPKSCQTKRAPFQPTMAEAMTDVTFDARKPMTRAASAASFAPRQAVPSRGVAAELNGGPRATALRQLQTSLNTRPDVVAQAKLSETLSRRGEAVPMQRAVRIQAPVQRVWKDIAGSYYEWEPSTDGLRWYQHKRTGKMYFVIEDIEQIAPEDRDYYLRMQGALLSSEKWLSDQKHWSERQVSADDLRVVGQAPPEPDEPKGFHEVGAVGRSKQIGRAHSRAGTLERMVQELYLTGQDKKIDAHDIIRKLKTLRTLGPQWEELAADPSIMLRPGMFDKFFALMQQQGAERGSDPWKGRATFAKTLGASDVYRAIYVKPEVAKGLADKELRKQNVLLPGYCVKQENACDCAAVLTNIERELAAHVAGNGMGIGQSVTKDKKVAEAVANHVRLKELGGHIPFSEEKAVYLLTLRIPNLDLFYVGELTHDFDNFVIDLGRADVHYPVPYSRDAEQVVLGPIIGASIVSVEEIEDPQGKAQPRQKG